MPSLPPAEPPRVAAENRARLRRREWVFLSVFLLIAVVAWVNFKRVEVRGVSMEPTFHTGDLVTVWKTIPRSSLRPGDVIVFRSTDGDELIKRIAAIAPGPKPHFSAWLELSDGRREAVAALFNPVYSPYFAGVLLHQIPPPAPGRMIYVLGDNLPRSDDSRDFGPISAHQILGKVIP